MSDSPKTKSTNPRDWPKEWVTDPDFWRDVATRTTASIITVVFVFVMGLAGGYLNTPENLYLFTGVGLSILAAVVIVFYVYILMVPRKGVKTISLDEAAAKIRAKRRRRYGK